MAKVTVDQDALAEVLRLARVTSILLYEEGSIHAHVTAEHMIQKISIQAEIEVTSTEEALYRRKKR